MHYRQNTRCDSRGWRLYRQRMGGNGAGGSVPFSSALLRFCNAGNFMFGDAPRSAFFGLRNPCVYNLDLRTQRTFNITPERVRFVFRVDCQNVTNKVTFGGIGVSANSASFGTPSTAPSNTAAATSSSQGESTSKQLLRLEQKQKQSNVKPQGLNRRTFLQECRHKGRLTRHSNSLLL